MGSWEAGQGLRVLLQQWLVRWQVEASAGPRGAERGQCSRVQEGCPVGRARTRVAHGTKPGEGVQRGPSGDVPRFCSKVAGTVQPRKSRVTPSTSVRGLSRPIPGAAPAPCSGPHLPFCCAQGDPEERHPQEPGTPLWDGSLAAPPRGGLGVLLPSPGLSPGAGASILGCLRAVLGARRPGLGLRAGLVVLARSHGGEEGRPRRAGHPDAQAGGHAGWAALCGRL